MPNENGNSPKWIVIAKDFIALLRDSIIFILFLLILFFPKTINNSLSNAGFIEGEIAGFTWKNQIKESNDKTKIVGQTVSDLENKLTTVKSKLDSFSTASKDTNVKKQIEKLSIAIDKSEAKANEANRLIKSAINSQQQIGEKVGISQPPTIGWIYLGKLNQKKSAWTKGSPISIENIDPNLTTGKVLTIKDLVYLRSDSNNGIFSSAKILGVIAKGETVEVIEWKYAHSIIGGWYVWTKVKK